ncbi:unnamed protein product, partial [Iphiclides podalirius]
MGLRGADAKSDSKLSRRPTSSVDVREMAAVLTSQYREVCCGRVSDSALVCKKRSVGQPGCQLLTLPAENTTETIEKLKNLINATRCSCSSKNIESSVVENLEQTTAQNLKKPV